MYAQSENYIVRRSELTNLTLKDVQQRNNRWCIVDLVGKHRRAWKIPMLTWVKNASDTWTMVLRGTDGHLFRPVNRGDQVCGDRMSENVVRQMLKTCVGGSACRTSRPTIFDEQPNLCRAAGGELEQTQLLLGHSSIQTTER